MENIRRQSVLAVPCARSSMVNSVHGSNRACCSSWMPHHIVQRVVRGMDAVFSDDDRYACLHLLSEFGRRFGVSFLAWCVMTNHVHLIGVPEDESSLAREIRSFDTLLDPIYCRTPAAMRLVRGFTSDAQTQRIKQEKACGRVSGE